MRPSQRVMLLREQGEPHAAREVWRAVVGYEGRYEVSNCGSVRSLDALLPHGNGYSRQWRGKLLKNYVDPRGYHIVNLHAEGKSRPFGVHALVARAFIPNPENLPLVRHLDDLKANNAVANLAWGTIADNNADKCRNGTSGRALTLDDVRCIKRALSEASRRPDGHLTYGEGARLARLFDISDSLVSLIERGRVWEHCDA